MDVVRVRHVRLVHLHEVDVHEEGRVRLCRLVEIVERRLFDIAVEKRDTNHAIRIIFGGRVGGVNVLAVDLEFLDRSFTRIAGHRALGHLCEHGPQFWAHIRKPCGVSVGVCVQVIETGVFHLVIALRIGQCIVGFAQVPFAGEERVVATGFQHGGQRPFGGRQSTALPLESHSGHATAVGYAPGLHRGSTRRAAWLGIK